MNGNELLLDTNILVYALKGLNVVRPYFEEIPFISVITQIEIMGVSNTTALDIATREIAIGSTNIIPLTNNIIQKAIKIKQETKILVPDAIIAATAIIEGFTLVTADKGYKKIKSLKLILIEI